MSYCQRRRLPSGPSTVIRMRRVENITTEDQKTMEVKKVFRNLVTNQYMDDLDYTGTIFSFQTVFHLDTVFSYCICTCGFEHEYLDYITESGTIDEDKYEKIVKCIIDGMCPHVSQRPKEFVKETKIYGIHIAAAVGTIEAVANSISRMPIRYGGLYHMDAFSLAILKNSRDYATMSILKKYFGQTEDYQITLTSAEKSCNNSDKIRLRTQGVLDFLAKKKNIKLLERYLTSNYSFLHMTLRASDEDVLRLCLQHKLDHVLGFKLDKSLDNFEDLGHFLSFGDTLILYYDDAKHFDKLLVSMKTLIAMEEDSYLKTNLNYKCYLFQSKKCEKVLIEHGCYTPNISKRMPVEEQVEILFDLLLEGQPVLKPAITEALAGIPNLCHTIKYHPMYDRLMLMITGMKDPRVLITILGYEIDVDTVLIDIIHMDAFSHHLTDEIFTLRQAVELYLYENPDTDINNHAVARGIKADKKIYNLKCNDWITDSDFHLTGVYQMDGYKHSLFGHDERDTFALNFIVPLLLECGFPLPNKVQGKEVYEFQLHPNETEYIKSYKSIPRSLKVCCRDSLRKHFKGRQIHKFVKHSSIPKSIKDFILLKPLLKTLSADLFN